MMILKWTLLKTKQWSIVATLLYCLAPLKQKDSFDIINFQTTLNVREQVG